MVVRLRLAGTMVARYRHALMPMDPGDKSRDDSGVYSTEGDVSRRGQSSGFFASLARKPPKPSSLALSKPALARAFSSMRRRAETDARRGGQVCVRTYKNRWGQ